MRKIMTVQNQIEKEKAGNQIKAHINLVAVYVISGMYKEAIEVCKQAVGINPDFVTAHCWLGFIYVSLNDKGSALEQYNILKRLDHERANELYTVIHK
jgi:tetratricopeptide (TPR) repeat protein